MSLFFLQQIYILLLFSKKFLEYSKFTLLFPLVCNFSFINISQKNIL